MRRLRRTVSGRNVNWNEKSKAFEVTTCEAHRMMASERGKLRFAKAANRRIVFEAIKRTKLVDEAIPPASFHGPSPDMQTDALGFKTPAIAGVEASTAHHG